MTQTLEIGGAQDRAVHVLAINLDAKTMAAAQDGAARDAMMLRLLGQAPDKPANLDLIAIADLEGLGLSGFLQEGPGIEAATLAPHTARLDALEGHVLVLHPGAFAAQTTLTLGAELTHIASLAQPGPDWSDAQTLTSAAATETMPAKKKPSDAAMSGRIAMLALLVIGLLTWVMILIA